MRLVILEHPMPILPHIDRCQHMFEPANVMGRRDNVWCDESPWIPSAVRTTFERELTIRRAPPSVDARPIRCALTHGREALSHTQARWPLCMGVNL